MIPKTIHYCWFGRNPKPKLAEKCIKSWKNYCKGYKIIEWNEDNFDVFACPLYVRQAYESKQWAFVTDYVRLKVVYDNGGIYLDTDVQVIKPLDGFLKYKSFFGFEEKEYVATGLGFGAEKNSKIIKEVMKQYEDVPFIKADGSFECLPCPQRNTEVFKSYGLVQNGETQYLSDGVVVFASEYFCPISYETLKKRITKKTYTIHWFSASWHDKETKEKERIRRKKNNRKYKKEKRRAVFFYLPKIFIKRILGEKKYEIIKSKIKK